MKKEIPTQEIKDIYAREISESRCPDLFALTERRNHQTIIPPIMDKPKYIPTKEPWKEEFDAIYGYLDPTPLNDKARERKNNIVAFIEQQIHLAGERGYTN